MGKGIQECALSATAGSARCTRNIPANWSWTRSPNPRLPGIAPEESDFFAAQQPSAAHRSLNSSNEKWIKSLGALMVPHWFIALLAALLPAWRFGGFKRRRRRGGR